jgi:antitoxin HigA-1
MAITLSPALSLHPGEWLRTEIVAAHGLSVTDVAQHLGVTRQAMSALLNSRAGLSADMAIRFEKAFGVKADTLLWMQTAYELAQARARENEIRVERFRDVA